MDESEQIIDVEGNENVVKPRRPYNQTRPTVSYTRQKDYKLLGLRNGKWVAINRRTKV